MYMEGEYGLWSRTLEVGLLHKMELHPIGSALELAQLDDGTER